MKYSDEHWWKYIRHCGGICRTRSVRMMCSLLNQWMVAMGRENWAYKKPELVWDDSHSEWILSHSLSEIIYILGPCRKALHEVVDEFISFFCLDDRVPTKAKLAFGDRNFISETERLGSDFALLILRVTHFTDNVLEVHRAQWLKERRILDGDPPYRFRYTNALSWRMLQAIEHNAISGCHFVVDRITEEQPRVHLKGPYYDSATGTRKERHSLILPYWGPPRAPLCYKANSSGRAASKRKRKHAMISTRPNGIVELQAENASDPEPVQFMSYGQIREEPEVEPVFHGEFSLTGMRMTDLTILDFLTPRELYDIQNLNPQMHNFVQTNFSREIQWAVDATKLLQDFFRNEYGRVHLLLSSWGREYEEESPEED